MNLSSFFAKKSRLWSILIGFILIGIVGYVDYVTGRDISFAVFYLLPIAFITWATGRVPGILAAIASAMTWFFDEYTGIDLSAYPAIPYWNAAGMLGFFLVVSYILAELKEVLEKERKMARMDFLTGADNSRAFAEAAASAISRGQRHGHPFSVAYFDLDNFKKVNDALGHSVGDELLRRVVKTIRNGTMDTDTVARLGGDEFAILLPDTAYEGAQETISKVQKNLLQAMQLNGWPVTFSIGVVTFNTPPASIDALISRVDAVMQSVKSGGKNKVRHEVADTDPSAH